MKKTSVRVHSVPALFSLLLFGLFTLFLLMMLLFSARTYQQETVFFQAEDSLDTASAYITTKFRQHDTSGGIFTDKLKEFPALCFRDTLDGKDYITYLYLDQNSLKELFTAADTEVSPDAGTLIAELSDFQAEALENGFYHIFLQSIDDRKSDFYLHSYTTGKEDTSS